MSTTTEAPPREPRCRMRNRRGDPCSNPSIDPDPNAPQICARHALEGAQLLAEAGAIKITYARTSTRSAR